jgi:hypothetical protein
VLFIGKAKRSGNRSACPSPTLKVDFSAGILMVLESNRMALEGPTDPATRMLKTIMNPSFVRSHLEKLDIIVVVDVRYHFQGSCGGLSMCASPKRELALCDPAILPSPISPKISGSY